MYTPGARLEQNFPLSGDTRIRAGGRTPLLSVAVTTSTMVLEANCSGTLSITTRPHTSYLCRGQGGMVMGIGDGNGGGDGKGSGEVSVYSVGA